MRLQYLNIKNSAVFRRKRWQKGSANVSITIGNPSKYCKKAVTGLGLVFSEKLALLAVREKNLVKFDRIKK